MGLRDLFLCNFLWIILGFNKDVLKIPGDFRVYNNLNIDTPSSTVTTSETNTPDG